MKKIESTGRRRYEGMKATPIKGIGIRNNTKTHTNGGIVAQNAGNIMMRDAT